MGPHLLLVLAALAGTAWCAAACRWWPYASCLWCHGDGKTHSPGRGRDWPPLRSLPGHRTPAPVRPPARQPVHRGGAAREPIDPPHTSRGSRLEMPGGDAPNEQHHREDQQRQQ